MSDRDFASTPQSRRVQGVAMEMVCLLALWLLLTRGDSSGLLFGLCVAAIATGVRNGLLSGPPLSLHPLVLARFLPGFIGQSLQAGADIALRAILSTDTGDTTDTAGALEGRRRFAIEPRLHQYGLQLPPGNARTFFIGVISLLPGTLSAEVEGDTLAVHVIGGSRDVGAQLSRLERRVAPLFGLDPPSRNGAGEKETIRGSDHG